MSTGKILYFTGYSFYSFIIEVLLGRDLFTWLYLYWKISILEQFGFGGNLRTLVTGEKLFFA